MSRLVQFSVPESDAECFEHCCGGCLEDKLKEYVAGIVLSDRENKIRTAVRLAMQTGASLPEEAKLSEFITAQQAVVDAKREADRLSK